MSRLELKIKEEKVSRATIFDLEIEAQELRQEILFLKSQRISARSKTGRLKKIESQLSRWKPMIEEKEAVRKLSPKDEAIRKRQEAEAEKARHRRLEREIFQPKVECLSWKEKERRRDENSRKKKTRRLK